MTRNQRSIFFNLQLSCFNLWSSDICSHIAIMNPICPVSINGDSLISVSTLQPLITSISDDLYRLGSPEGCNLEQSRTTSISSARRGCWSRLPHNLLWPISKWKRVVLFGLLSLYFEVWSWVKSLQCPHFCHKYCSLKSVSKWLLIMPLGIWC